MKHVLRQLGLDDMDQAAIVYRASFDAALPWLAGLHAPDEDRHFYRDTVFPACQLWGAFDGGQLDGFIAFRDGWIDHLYVLPRAQGQGLGSGLVAVAKQTCDELNLWTFQRNCGARKFYDSRGFQLVEETDGSGNEENEPDALYRWRRGYQT